MGGEVGQQHLVCSLGAGCVIVPAQRPGGWDQGTQLLLDALRSRAEVSDSEPSAFRTQGGGGAVIATAMTHQSSLAGMVRERDAATRTAGDPTTIAAEDERRLATAIQEQDGLLMSLQRLLQGLLQGPAEQGHVAGLELLTHVDNTHRGHISGVRLALVPLVVASDVQPVG